LDEAEDRVSYPPGERQRFPYPKQALARMRSVPPADVTSFVLTFLVEILLHVLRSLLAQHFPRFSEVTRKAVHACDMKGLSLLARIKMKRKNFVSL
jgi:hypothetical protein